MTVSDEGRPSKDGLPSRNLGLGFWVRLISVGLLDALALYAVPFLIGSSNWLGLAALLLGTAGVNFVYFTNRALPMRWLVPGTFFLVVMMLFPIGYTFFVSLHNWSTGHILTKEQAIERFERQIFEPEQGERFGVTVYRNPAGELRILLERGDGTTFFGTPRLTTEPPLEDSLVDLEDATVVDNDADGIPERVDDFVKLSLGELLQVQGVDDLVIDLPELGEARLQTATAAKLAQQRYVYDADRDVLIDQRTGVECEADGGRGNFVCAGEVLDPGWRVIVGFENFIDVATDERIREPFLRVFTWNVVFAGLVVAFQLLIGMLLALVLHEQRMRGKKIYRSLLILPWAMPGFISVLVWRGLLNQRFGKVNDLLQPIFDVFDGDRIAWLTDPFWAKAAVILVTVWLGFPYMFLVVSGALQAIPEELKEAARVDGATGGQVFRRITFPLLLVSIAPLLIASFAFNFNNFINVYLLTAGGPPLVGYDVPVGETDILISFTFNLAQASGRGQNFGLAAAITFFIFVIVAVLSAISFRYTKRLEDVYG